MQWIASELVGQVANYFLKFQNILLVEGCSLCVCQLRGLTSQALMPYALCQNSSVSMESMADCVLFNRVVGEGTKYLIPQPAKFGENCALPSLPGMAPMANGEHFNGVLRDLQYLPFCPPLWQHYWFSALSIALK